MKRGIPKQDDDSNNSGKNRLRRQRRQLPDEDETNFMGNIVQGGASRATPAFPQGTTSSVHSIETLGDNIHLPDYVREHNSTLTFPEKLMLTLTHVDRERSKSGIPESGESIGWVLDGTAFVVKNIDQFCATWLPMFFGQSKFSSFTRKLYRWGFRKINVASIPNGSSYGDNALFFGNEHFLRSDKSQLSMMKSVTAAKIRSGVLGNISKVRLPTEHSESEADESKPPAVVVVASNSNHQNQYPSAPEPSRADVASLMQQSANLSTLLSLLSSNPQAVLALNQSIQVPNSIVAPSILPPSIPPVQIHQVPQPNIDQMLQQLAVSTALLNASSAIPALPQSIPWWLNTGIPPQPLRQQPIPGWIVDQNRPSVNVPHPVTHNPADIERLRNVLDSFLRYSNSVQQQPVLPVPQPYQLVQQQQQHSPQQHPPQNIRDNSHSTPPQPPNPNKPE